MTYLGLRPPLEAPPVVGSGGGEGLGWELGPPEKKKKFDCG